MKNAKTIFFDLDGTLTDPKEGITKSIRFALEQMGYPSPPLDELAQYIGPTLRHYFAEIMEADKVEDAIGYYRQRYDTGGACLTENALYPDIPFILKSLKQHGKQLFVVTAKPHIIAVKIIKHFKLDHFFQHIYGAELNETRSDKAELIAHILEQDKMSPDSIVMVGDRKHDIIGATRNKIRSIGVRWGYGSAKELKEAGATLLVEHPRDLLKILIEA